MAEDQRSAKDQELEERVEEIVERIMARGRSMAAPAPACPITEVIIRVGAPEAIRLVSSQVGSFSCECGSCDPCEDRRSNRDLPLTEASEASLKRLIAAGVDREELADLIGQCIRSFEERWDARGQKDS